MVAYHDGKEFHVFTGEWKGVITEGISQKFNPEWQYNSIFIPEEFEKPLSEIPMEERAKHSHRKKALEKLKEHMQARALEARA